MLILPNRIRRLAFFAVFCVAWFNAAVGRPVEALSAVKKTVLVLYGDRLSIPAVKTTEQGLMAGLSRGQPEEEFSRNTSISRVSRRLSMGTISSVICAVNSTGARTFKHVWLLIFRSIWSSSCSDQMILSPSLTERPFASLSVPLG
jgi:hypothetical protein